MLAKSAKEHPFEWKNYVRKVCMVAYNPLLVIHLFNSRLGGKLDCLLMRCMELMKLIPITRRMPTSEMQTK